MRAKVGAHALHKRALRASPADQIQISRGMLVHIRRDCQWVASLPCHIRQPYSHTQSSLAGQLVAEGLS